MKNFRTPDERTITADDPAISTMSGVRGISVVATQVGYDDRIVEPGERFFWPLSRLKIVGEGYVIPSWCRLASDPGGDA